MLFHWIPKKAFSSLLRIANQTYQWAWKHLPLMLRECVLKVFNSKMSSFSCENLHLAYFPSVSMHFIMLHLSQLISRIIEQIGILSRIIEDRRLLQDRGILSRIFETAATAAIPWSGCDKTYTGQTGHLGTRLKEHHGSVRRHDTNSCLALHCMDTGHTFNWQYTRILGSANSQRVREAIEVLHSEEHSVNQFMQLDPCYRLIRLQH